MQPKKTGIIELTPTPPQLTYLKGAYSDYSDAIEEGFNLLKSKEQGIINIMKSVIRDYPLYEKINSSNDYHSIHLVYKDNNILNLPWQLLFNNEVIVTKGIDAGKIASHKFETINQAPLRILFLISSPLDSQLEYRLSYELEEQIIIDALSELIGFGKVVIEFTSDGSLEGLADRLSKEQYHIIHFSGHGVLKEGLVYLEMEDAITLNSRLVTFIDFASVIKNAPLESLPLILLSACRTAQGHGESEFEGSVNVFLQEEFPAIIAMGHSIRDDYAVLFSKIFYAKLVQESTIQQAFYAAISKIKEYEQKDSSGKNAPIQWLVPQLYMGIDCTNFVKWSEGKSFDKVILSEEEGKTNKNLFVGRRMPFRDALHSLEKNRNVVIVGQGGVGKTTLATYICTKLERKNNGYKPLFFYEDDYEIGKLYQKTKQFSKAIGVDFSDDTFQLNTGDTHLDKMIALLPYLSDENDIMPIIVLDNLEYILDIDKITIKQKYQYFIKLIEALLQNNIHLIITSRYKFESSIFSQFKYLDLNQARFNDFFIRCTQLKIQNLATSVYSKAYQFESNKITYRRIIEKLYNVLGGNYRLLDFLDLIITEKGNSIIFAESLKELGEEILGTASGSLEKLKENLVVEELIDVLTQEQKNLLSFLREFNVPVPATSTSILEEDNYTLDDFEKLNQLTLVERHGKTWGGESIICYFVPQLVKILLDNINFKTTNVDYSKKGEFLINQYDKLSTRNIKVLEAAFDAFYKSMDIDNLNDVGANLCAYYFEEQQFYTVLEYGKKVERKLKKKADKGILNYMGLVHEQYGELDKAMEYHKLVLEEEKRLGNLHGEGISANNIGLLYSNQAKFEDALKSYDYALKSYDREAYPDDYSRTLANMAIAFYHQGNSRKAIQNLKEAIEILEKTDNKVLFSGTMNNLGQILANTGAFEEANIYLNRSLTIQKEIDDNKGMAATLLNLGLIFDRAGELDKAKNYLERALEIAQDIQFKVAEGKALNNLGQIFMKEGSLKLAEQYFRKSLEIRIQTGDRQGEGTVLNNLGIIYKNNDDLEAAIKSFEEALKIHQDLEVKSQEAITLYNIAFIIGMQGRVDDFVKYASQAYEIALEINDSNGLYTIGLELGDVLCKTGKNIPLGLKILKTSLHIGQQAKIPNLLELEMKVFMYSQLFNK